MANKATIWVLEWVESEGGWGQRPDGFSLHASPKAAADYVASYWAGMPKERPHEYERPASDRPTAVEVDAAIAAWVGERDIRLWRSQARVERRGAEFELRLDPELDASARAEGEAALLRALTPQATKKGKAPGL